MKNVLLATTILGMTAGFASADIAFSGSAQAGFAQNGTTAGGKVNVGTVGTTKTNDNEILPYASMKLVVTATGETDSGLTFGAAIDATGGLGYAMADDDGFEAKSGAFGKPTIFIAGDFGKVTVKANGFKEYKDDSSETYDIEYTHTIGGLSVGLRSDLQSATTAGGKASTAGKSSLKLGYSVAGIDLGATYDQVGSKWSVSAGRAFGPVTATLSTDEASKTKLKVAYKSDMINGYVQADSKNGWEVNAGYTANGITFSATTDQASKWKATAAYDLGGGLSLEAGSNYTSDMFLGAKMAF